MFNDLQKLDDLVNLFHHDVQVPFAAITIQNCCVAGIQNLRVLVNSQAHPGHPTRKAVMAAC